MTGATFGDNLEEPGAILFCFSKAEFNEKYVKSQNLGILKGAVNRIRDSRKGFKKATQKNHSKVFKQYTKSALNSKLKIKENGF